MSFHFLIGTPGQQGYKGEAGIPGPKGKIIFKPDI